MHKEVNILSVEIMELCLGELCLPLTEGAEIVSGWVEIHQGQRIALVEGEEVTRLIKHEKEGEMLLTISYSEEEAGGAAFLGATISATESGKEYRVVDYVVEADE